MTVRNDVTIDNRKIVCPKTSRIGFDKPFAKAGDVIVYAVDNTDFPRLSVGRVLGRVSTHDGEVKGHALVLQLSEDCGGCFERWVDPAMIRQVIDAPTAFAEFFFAPKLPYDVQTMRRLADHGALSHLYIDRVPERVAMFAARDKGV